MRQLAELGASFKEVVAIKVGFTLALRYGLPLIVKAINEVSTLPVIYDHQKAGTDIPQMGKPFAATCQEAGVQGVIFFPLAGPKTLEGFVSGAIELGLKPIVGLVMTHPMFLVSEGGYLDDAAPEAICKAAVELGVRNYVLPGTKPSIISRFAKGLFAQDAPATIMMPGIGSQGGTLAAAFDAASPHNRIAIVGSAIYGSPDPKAALNSLVKEIKL